MSGGKSDDDTDDEASGESVTPSNTPPGSPTPSRNKKPNGHIVVHPKNRDTLVQEDFPKPSAIKTTRSPSVSAAATQIKIIKPSPGVQSNGRVRSPSLEKPPELPTKTTRVAPPVAKKSVFALTVTPNRLVNKENEPGRPPQVPLPAPTPPEAKPVQRNKSKSQRRKITEEEAIRDLGKWSRTDRSLLVHAEPCADFQNRSPQPMILWPDSSSRKNSAQGRPS